MSRGLAQETGHVMVQGAAREGCEAISSCTMQGDKGHEIVGGRGVHRDKTIHFQAPDGLADASDAVYTSAGVKNLCSSTAYNIFRSLPSVSPGSASPPVASAGKGSRASSTILARLGIPPANGTGRARTVKAEAHPTSLSIVALRRKQAFRLFSGTPTGTKCACTSDALRPTRTAAASGPPAQRDSMASAKRNPGACGRKMKLSYTKMHCGGLFQTATLWRRQKQPHATA